MVQIFLLLLILALSVFSQRDLVSFSHISGSVLLADSSTGPSIHIADNDWPGVHRTVQDLAGDFGRVTGTHGTYRSIGTDTESSSASTLVIVAGTIGNSSLVDAFI